MRIVPHPGQRLDRRSTTIVIEATAPTPLHITEGQDLFATVHAALDTLGVSGGAFVLTSGHIAKLTLMTGGAGRDGKPMGFHGPHILSPPLTVVAGAGGVGIDEDGRRFSHCHAAFVDSSRRLVGGHLLPDETIAGAGGLYVDLVTYGGGRFVKRIDPETQFDIFHPEAV